jgi:hypothetical protein
MTTEHLLFLLAAVAFARPAHADQAPPAPLQAESFPGADLGARVNAAVASLKLKVATIRVTEQGEIRTPISLDVGQTLEFGPGAWTCAAAPCITVDSGSRVLGAGVFLTRLVLGPKSAGPMIQSRDFNALVGKPEAELLKIPHALKGDHKYLPGVKYVRIQLLTLDGNLPAHPLPANGIELYGFWYWLEHLSIERFAGNGLVTEFVASGWVDPLGNDTNESYFTDVKFVANKKVGWVNRGPHDSIATGVIAANNGEWGIDVIHKEGYHSGAGLMLSNTHLYGNGGGLRTSRGANIITSNFESEANHGSGLLLRSNDNIIQGFFYANAKHGIELGEGDAFSAANTLNVQLHNNTISQVLWANSGGHTVLTGAVYAMPGQGYFTGNPDGLDLVLTAGNATPQGPLQHFPGGALRVAGDGAAQLGQTAPGQPGGGPLVIPGNGKVVIDAKKGSLFWVELQGTVKESQITNAKVGQMITIIVGQGKAGNMAFAWPKDFQSPPQVDQAPSRATVTVRVFDGSNWAVVK